MEGQEYLEIEFQGKVYKWFLTIEEAEDYRAFLHGDDCMDNLRFCMLPFHLNLTYSGIVFEMMESNYQDYLEQKDSGCCGFMDEEIFINDQMCIIGCNFGH